MKQSLFVIAATVLVISCGIAHARAIRNWSFQELFDKSDLVVIATPTASDDTQEKTELPGLAAQRVIGVETKFKVSGVLKGEKPKKDLVLHHYKVDGGSIPNGPILVSFDLKKERTYLLFLVREEDDRYAPVVGQVDPGHQGINVLKGLAD
jgi:hypothetical protein